MSECPHWVHATVTPTSPSSMFLWGAESNAERPTDCLTNQLDSVRSVVTPQELASVGVARISGWLSCALMGDEVTSFPLSVKGRGQEWEGRQSGLQSRRLRGLPRCLVSLNPPVDQ